MSQNRGGSYVFQHRGHFTSVARNNTEALSLCASGFAPLAISSPALFLPSLSHETEVRHDGRKEGTSLHLPGVVEDELVVGGEGGVHVRRGPPRRRVVRPGRAGKTVAAVVSITNSLNFLLHLGLDLLGISPQGIDIRRRHVNIFNNSGMQEACTKQLF